MGGLLVDVRRDVQPVAEESEVETEVVVLDGLPPQVRVTDGAQLGTYQEAVAECITGVGAQERKRRIGRDALVTHLAPAETQLTLAQPGDVVLDEGLFGEAPGHGNGREESILVACREAGGTVDTARRGQVVAVVVVVHHTGQPGHEGVEAGGSVAVFGLSTCTDFPKGVRIIRRRFAGGAVAVAGETLCRETEHPGEVVLAERTHIGERVGRAPVEGLAVAARSRTDRRILVCGIDVVLRGEAVGTGDAGVDVELGQEGQALDRGDGDGRADHDAVVAALAVLAELLADRVVALVVVGAGEVAVLIVRPFLLRAVDRRGRVHAHRAGEQRGIALGRSQPRGQVEAELDPLGKGVLGVETDVELV